MPSTNYIKNNPLRYRGYVYDPETELYYCQSRYYDPKIGRFLNADGLVSTGQGIIGNNMFAYCNNNPVKYSDHTGNFSSLDLADNPAADIGKKIGEWLAEKFRRRWKEIEESKEENSMVSFTPSKNGGGQVKNSFLITSWSDIYEYSCNLKQQYPDNFKGSATGMTVEWVVHNVACYFPFFSLERAKDVDLGYTIFDDSHPGMNLAMWAMYYLLSPEQYQADLEAGLLS